jgi:hypothetical protein
MATNLDLDEKLIERAVRLGAHKTKKEAVTAALQEYVNRREQAKIVDLFGTIDFDPAYDYKAERQRKRMPAINQPSRAERRQKKNRTA